MGLLLGKALVLGIGQQLLGLDVDKLNFLALVWLLASSYRRQVLLGHFGHSAIALTC